MAQARAAPAPDVSTFDGAKPTENLTERSDWAYKIGGGAFSAGCSLGGDRKTVPEMLGEFLREAGLLVAVFIPLDMIFSGRPMPSILFIMGMVTSLVFLVVGILIERKRS